MMTKEIEKNRTQIQFLAIDDLVPENHLLRDIERSISFDFIYDLVQDKYCNNNGRPSIDPVMLIKIPLIQYLYGIKSMRQTIKDIEVNVAYRWFLGLDLTDKVPHFTTFGKNYTRRFEGTDLFEQIFSKILEECINCKLVDETTIFVDATHVKANANRKKFVKATVKNESKFYESALQKEIAQDREFHNKKPLKDKNDDDNTPSSGGTTEDRTIKQSTTDPDSGWFHKGEHKEVFAYAVQTACDRYGWILDYTIHPGNEHDSRTFPKLYAKLKKFDMKMLVADAGYKIPAIAKMIIDDGIKPLFPYKRPMTKAGFFKKYEFAYDEMYDCYICPNNQVLNYTTTNRDGYKEYKSSSYKCKDCPHLYKCTQSKEHTKLITRHVWEEYMELCEDIRHTKGNQAIYELRKETIERIFGTGKENHNLRYTRQIGKARMEMKIGLTFACMNLKKLAKIKRTRGLMKPLKGLFVLIFPQTTKFYKIKRQSDFAIAC